jgi:putative ABC transport system substrate-binding protein
MRRREFVASVGAIAAWPLAAHAQQAARVWRIGLLMLVAETDPQAQTELTAFATELRRLGWTAGQNIRIDQRWANGDVGRLQALAAEL